ncbi:MAG TPA: metallophosphoesterase, partial [Acidimicrobiia bacterium]|nr:metallophosphoesterase [Acidimicrobiia bacterium]
TRALMFATATALILAGCGGDAGTTTTDASTTTSVMATTTSSTVAVTSTAPSTTTTTLGDRGSDALLVIGDWGSGTLPQGAVAGAMMRYAEDNAVEAILTTGDNFYSDDAEFLMHPFGWATEAGIPFWITWGNHDLDSAARIAAVNEAFDDPPRWTTHRWGNVLVVILDSNQPDSDDQIDFLTETLADTDLPTLVVFHHPPYRCGSYGHNETIQQNWVTRFDDDVLLVLSGHEHTYERFEDGGITYVVTGGGGATLTEVGACPAVGPQASAAESTHHFLVLEQADNVTVTVVDTGGEPIDEFELALP